MSTKRKPTKPKCEAQTQICSGEMVAAYHVNGSPQTFNLCGACKVYLGRTNRITR